MKNILVVFGGRSAEHDVSIITAHTPIIDALQTQKDVTVWPCYITKQGTWYVDKRFSDMEYFRDSSYQDKLKQLSPVDLSVGDGLEIVWPGLRRKRQKIDVVFPAMHGTYGEDGSLMGLLRMANVPFVGCDMAASAVAMDKVLTKQVTEPLGVASVPYVWFTKDRWAGEKKQLLDEISQLSLPLFVKPAHLGSSIGISKVSHSKDLIDAIEVVMHYDDKAIVEQGVQDLIEVTVPLMVGQDEHWLAKVERPNAEFFDFETKYIGGGKKTGGSGVNQGYSEIPAKLEPKLYQECEDIALATARILGLYGISRVDLLIDAKAKKVYMNEVNTLPGSLYVHNWKQAGVSGVELVTKLITLAEERYAQQQKLQFTFKSSVLSQAQGQKFNN